MLKRSFTILGVVFAALVAAVWLYLATWSWEYSARTWRFRLTHHVVAVKDVKEDSGGMPYTYRDVYFITTPGNAEVDVKACAVAFGHNHTSETETTRCHAFTSINGAQAQADNEAICEVASSHQTPYMRARSVKVIPGGSENCDDRTALPALDDMVA